MLDLVPFYLCLTEEIYICIIMARGQILTCFAPGYAVSYLGIEFQNFIPGHVRGSVCRIMARGQILTTCLAPGYAVSYLGMDFQNLILGHVIPNLIHEKKYVATYSSYQLLQYPSINKILPVLRSHRVCTLNWKGLNDGPRLSTVWRPLIGSCCLARWERAY
jgi:hypothetical protein